MKKPTQKIPTCFFSRSFGRWPFSFIWFIILIRYIYLLRWNQSTPTTFFFAFRIFHQSDSRSNGFFPDKFNEMINRNCVGNFPFLFLIYSFSLSIIKYCGSFIIFFMTNMWWNFIIIPFLPWRILINSTYSTDCTKRKQSIEMCCSFYCFLIHCKFFTVDRIYTFIRLNGEYWVILKFAGKY